MNSKLDTENSTLATGNSTEKPPAIVGSWRSLYTIVLVELGILVVLFYLFTKAFE